MSKYCVITARDGDTFETTNIGVIIFDKEGNQHSCKIAPIYRAQRRGDYPMDDDGSWIKEWAEEVKTEEIYRKKVDTFSHAMSCVQLGRLGGSILPPEQLMDHVYPKMVKEETQEPNHDH